MESTCNQMSSMSLAPQTKKVSSSELMDMVVNELNDDYEFTPSEHVPNIPSDAIDVRLLLYKGRQVTMYFMPKHLIQIVSVDGSQKTFTTEMKMALFQALLAYSKFFKNEEWDFTITHQPLPDGRVSFFVSRPPDNPPLYLASLTDQFLGGLSRESYLPFIKVNQHDYIFCVETYDANGVNRCVVTDFNAESKDSRITLVKAAWPHISTIHHEACMGWTFNGLPAGQYMPKSMLGFSSEPHELARERMTYYARPLFPSYSVSILCELSPSQFDQIEKHIAPWKMFMDSFWLVGDTVANAFMGIDEWDRTTIDVIPSTPQQSIQQLLKTCPYNNVFVINTPLFTILLKHSGDGKFELTKDPELRIWHMTPLQYAQRVGLTMNALMMDASMTVYAPYLVDDLFRNKKYGYDVRRIQGDDQRIQTGLKLNWLGYNGWKRVEMPYEEIDQRGMPKMSDFPGNIPPPVCFKQIADVPNTPCTALDIGVLVANSIGTDFFDREPYAEKSLLKDVMNLQSLFHTIHHVRGVHSHIRTGVTKSVFNPMDFNDKLSMVEEAIDCLAPLEVSAADLM